MQMTKKKDTKERRRRKYNSNHKNPESKKAKKRREKKLKRIERHWKERISVDATTFVETGNGTERRTHGRT